MQALEVLRGQQLYPTSSKQLHAARASLVNHIQEFKEKHRTPYGLLYIENGRGMHLQEHESLHMFGWPWNMCTPVTLALL
mmetsp:Transcript_15414/g.41735  ORF Transcript_15414/g.41735 Transcript_15414/m.41735 type:complete len:80 (-) Transcript_15414:1364-1603(-)